ncbi:MAG: cation:proton antiporter [Candidatus Sumerlaeia bacterium]|nr:cation:proton antiporter [Candidatus Sumerlaeia bacterium]
MPHDIQALQTLVLAASAGVFLIVLARRLAIPSIVALLLGGLALGPHGVGVILPENLGHGLRSVIACAVAVILFEGGLTLDLRGYRSASRVIRRLLTVGLLATWLLTAGIIWLLFRFPPAACLQAGSLVIVTGPTVIGPLLKRIRIHHRVHNILHWESVLIDAFGVFAAVLCFEWVSPDVGSSAAVAQFAGRIAAGAGLGLLGGFVAELVLRRGWIPDDLVNLAVLAVALTVFTLSESILGESGLLAVVIAGFTLAVRVPGRLREIREFKAQLTDLFIGLLFLLLAANLDPAQFLRHGWRLPVLVVAVMFIVRPVSIVLSSLGSDLTLRERALLSWIAPRGIVAASMGSLFALVLEERGFPEAEFLETFTYSVIAATVVLQGFSAGVVAQALHLRRPDPRGWLIVGANRFACDLARLVASEAKVPVTLVDSNARLVEDAQARGLDALRADALSPDLPNRLEDHEVAHVLALTDNEDLNTLVCQRWGRETSIVSVFRWVAGSGAPGRGAGAGRGIWSGVPKPSIISSEIAAGHAQVLIVRGGLPRSGDAFTCLGELTERGVVFGTAASGESGTATLWLRRQADFLRRATRPELIVRFERGDIRAVLRELLSRAALAEPGLPCDEIMREFLRTDPLAGTVLGNGIAVPHTGARALTRPLCAVAQIPAGLDGRPDDEEPLRLIFLLIHPAGDPTGHLSMLADVARLARTPGRVEAITNASTAEEAFEHIVSAARGAPEAE